MTVEDFFKHPNYNGPGMGIFSPKKSVGYLIENLPKHESILVADLCECEGVAGGVGPLVLTESHLIFAMKGSMGNKLIDMPIKNITRIESSFAVGCKLEVYQASDKKVFKIFGEPALSNITKKLNELMGKQQQLQQPTNTPPAPANDPLAELEKLASLKEKGILTEEEFAAKKKQLLGL